MKMEKEIRAQKITVQRKEKEKQGHFFYRRAQKRKKRRIKDIKI